MTHAWVYRSRLGEALRRSLVSAQGQIGKKKVVIQYQQVGVKSGIARFHQKTARIICAFFTEAIIVFRSYLAPDEYRGLGVFFGKIGEGTIVGLFRPASDAGKFFLGALVE